MKFVHLLHICLVTWISVGEPYLLDRLPLADPEIDLPLASASGFGYDSYGQRMERRRPASDYRSQLHTEPYITGNCYGYPPGSIGDAEADCTTFEVCQSDGRLDVFHCPEYTKFNNYLGVCDWHWQVDRYCNSYYEPPPTDYYNMGEYHGYAEEEGEEPYAEPRPPPQYSQYGKSPPSSYKRPEISVPYSLPVKSPIPPRKQEPVVYVSRGREPTSLLYEGSPVVYPLEFKRPVQTYEEPRITFEPAPLTYSEKAERPRPSPYPDYHDRLGYDQIYEPSDDSPYKPYYLVRKKYLYD